ncbi:MAG: nucleoside-triphosphatase [Candidatus Izemoplasmatales bacterium]
MIKIITGKINSYKTTRLIDYYQNYKQGDGFASLKVMHNDIVKEYNLLHLSKNKKIPYIKRNNQDITEPVIYEIGPYRFLKSAFDYVETEIEKMIEKRVEPIFLDEISLLELKNQGFHQILIKLLAADLDLILVIRNDLLIDVLAKYQFKDYKIIK